MFDHYREQAIFSEFCLFTCPLLIGADLLKISPETIELLKNKNLIGVNQDEAGVPGVLARYYDPWHSLYKKHLADGSVVFLIVNRCHGNTLTTIEAELDMNLPADTCFEVHDLWEGKSLGVHQGVFDIFVETSDVPTTPCCRMLKVRVLKA